MNVDAPQPQLSQQALLVYKKMLDDLDYLKKQQWATTNYLVLIYAAIIWYGQHVSISQQLLCVLSAIAVAAGGIAGGLLIWFQYDLGELRKRISEVNENCFSKGEQQALKLEPYSHPYGRGWHVLAALVLVCIFGALFVILALMKRA